MDVRVTHAVPQGGVAGVDGVDVSGRQQLHFGDDPAQHAGHLDHKLRRHQVRGDLQRQGRRRPQADLTPGEIGLDHKLSESSNPRGMGPATLIVSIVTMGVGNGSG